MRQEIIITDLTHMSGEHVCLAGVDRKGNTIRPMLQSGIFIRDLYIDNYLLRPRIVVSMELEPQTNRIAPHLEDHSWKIEESTQILRLAADNIWRIVLQRTSFNTVRDIFEVDLHENKNIRPGEGSRSIGTIKAKSIDFFEYKVLQFGQQQRQGYRLSFTDSEDNSFQDISITDLTLRYYTHHLKRSMKIQELNEVIREKFHHEEIWLRIGLTREWNEWCWLQVNGIYTFPDYLNGSNFDTFRKQGVELPDY